MSNLKYWTICEFTEHLVGHFAEMEEIHERRSVGPAANLPMHKHPSEIIQTSTVFSTTGGILKLNAPPLLPSGVNLVRPEGGWIWEY